MKKVILVFAGAAASFLLFAYIDEYENLILPLLPGSRAERPFVGRSEEVNADLKRTIMAFNDTLSKAYLGSDPSLLADGPVDKELIAFIAQDIDYLTREGKVMSLDASEVTIVKVEALSPVAVRVKTKEIVGVSYFSYPGKERKMEYPLVEYEMRYTLSGVGGNWNVLSFETINTKEKKQ